ncbi:reticulon-like protein B23 isoform X3 [Durio zibethinus]|uniref:Reticulon-like protein B23 isoform X3 n=1 Tax=Durio zibethinus TaxID=66656 RepID=A0A6P5WKW9_DURZI|nr:reticulon-like protein B23 isoform X3 [Durio zibethinus]
MEGRNEVGKALGLLICGSLVYYHCAYRNSSILSLVSDVLIVLLCSLAILGLLFRQMNISLLFVFTYCQLLDDWSQVLQLLMPDYACSVFTCLLRTPSRSEHVFLSYKGNEMAPLSKRITCNCMCSLNIQLGQQVKGSELCFILGQFLSYPFNPLAETVELQ